MMNELPAEKTLSVSVIIPVLNEDGSIRELHERISKQMKTVGMPYEIIFIDDGSTDGTNELLEEICAADDATGYIRHFRAHGKSLALMQGFESARGDIAVTMDGDLQDEPENIGLLISEMLHGGFDLVNGCRFNRQDTASKKFVSWMFNQLVRMFFRLPLRDVNSGFKAFSINLYKRLELRGDLHRLIPVIAFNNGYKLTEINISSSPRKTGKSKYKLLRYRGLLDLFSLMAIHSTQLRPFHVFGGLGALLCIVGLGSTVATLVLFSSKMRVNAEIILFLMSQTLLLFGSMLFLFGMVAEMLIAPMQNTEWRGKWIRETHAPKGSSKWKTGTIETQDDTGNSK